MPYRYLNSKIHEQKLIFNLTKYGYEFVKKVPQYREESLNFNRIWSISEELIIKWEREFVLDGLDEQDLRVIISINDSEIGVIDIDHLLRSKLDISLNEKVYNRITDIINTHSRIRKGESHP